MKKKDIIIGWILVLCFIITAILTLTHCNYKVNHDSRPTKMWTNGHNKG